MPLLRTAAAVYTLALLATSSGCDERPPPEASVLPQTQGRDEPAQPPSDEEANLAPDPPPESAQQASPTPPSIPQPAPTPEEDDEPLEFRRAARATMLYDAPRFSAAFRGKIARGETFAVHARVDDGDPDCTGGWARVGHVAFACLGRSEVAEGPPPRALPPLRPGRVVPFLYAKRKTNVPAPVWRSRAALRRGDDPVGELDLDHDYAFVGRRWANRERVLVDDTRRVVKEADVRRFQPSSLEGRDLANVPLPSEGTLAWVVAWPSAALLETAHPDAKPSGKLEFQTTIVLDDEPTRRRGKNFYPLHDGSGWVEAAKVRRYIPADAIEGVADDAVWVDVEITQQTLTLWRGQTPVFVTLISSGTGKNPTPLGLYRMESKHALTDMRSKPGDDDAYHVEAVPWAMYFEGRFALHGAYWHNRFGNRLSHGCVNLAPKDAKRVFDALGPPLPNGWLTVYEHEEDLGSLVRIRKKDAEPPDRRRSPRKRTAS